MITGEMAGDRAGTRAMRKMSRQMGDKPTYELPAVLRIGAPYAMIPITFACASALRLAFDSLGQTLLGGVLFALSTGGLSYLRWRTTHQRDWLGRPLAVSDVAAPMALITAIVGYGYHASILLSALVIGITLAIGHNIRHTRHAETGALAVGDSGTGGQGHARALEWRKWTEENLPSAYGSEMTVLEDSKERLMAGLDLRPGQVPEDIIDDLPRVESWAGGIRQGATAIVGAFQNKVMLLVPRRDSLEKPIAWPGVDGPGVSIAEPITVGVYRDGSPLSLTLPHTKVNGKPKVLANLLTAGMPGAGKTEAGLVLDITIASRAESALILADGVKADQSLHGIGEAAALVLNSLVLIRWLLNRLVTHTVPARAAYLGNPSRNLLGRSLKNWEPGCGLKFTTLHLGEAGALVGVDTLTKVVEQCRSVGIWLHVELQRASHTKVDTDARASFGAGQAFGTESDVDARMVLSDQLVDLGADPSAWQADNPGYVYMEGPWVPRARRTMPGRYFNITSDAKRDDIADAVAEHQHLFQVLDPVTADSLGDTYRKFRAMVDARRDGEPRQYSFNPAAHGPRETQAPAGGPAVLDGAAMLVPADEAVEDDELTPEEEDQMRHEATADVTAEINDMAEESSDLEDAFETSAELRAAFAEEPEEPGTFVRDDEADVAFTDEAEDKGPKLSRDEAIDLLLGIIAQVGVGREFQPKDLYEQVKELTGREGTWVRQTLPVLVARGHVEPTSGHGRYVVLEGERIPAMSYAE